MLQVRLQADTGLGGVPKRYSGIGNALVTIVKTEGVLGLYTGMMGTMRDNSYS